MRYDRLSVKVVALAFLFAFSARATGADNAIVDSMTYKQAKQRVPEREIPEFWVGDVATLPARLARLAEGKVTTIATSPGGRPVHLIEYGQAEKLESKANFNSAIGAREPSVYMDKTARKKPVILFVGPVHGAEVEGLTGLVNFVNIMETGRDLRGSNHAELRALGRQCRLLVILTESRVSSREVFAV